MLLRRKLREIGVEVGVEAVVGKLGLGVVCETLAVEDVLEMFET